MTIVTRATAKSYFELGDKPSQSDFSDLIDSSIFQEDFGSFGKAFVSAATTASAVNILGAGVIGRAVFQANTTASAQSNVGLVIGTDVQAYDPQLASLAALPSVANLEALAGLTGAANKIPYFTGAGAMGVTDFTPNNNLLINGAMAIDQRNAGASQTITAGAALAYTVDRWYAYCTGANVTGQRVAGTAPNQYNYRFTGAASVTKIGFAQRIEAANSQHLAGQTATLSVDLANSLLTTVTWTAWYANSADTFGSLASPTRTQIATGTFTVTSTLTRFSASISIPSAATTGIEIEFSVGAQTSGTFTIGRAQLELGNAATTFEYRLLPQELSLCQRYFYSVSSSICYFLVNGTTSVLANMQFPVSMRIAPTMTLTDTSIDIVKPGVTSTISSGSTINSSTTTTEFATVSITGYTGLTIQDIWISSQSTNFIVASSEL